jgi:Protein of unknown function (DUF1553)/Protein of unknown function (DUF1549)/Concanavalin A-like lectin/glucanases superfamily/Planctomycete cytochrome C
MNCISRYLLVSTALLAVIVGSLTSIHANDIQYNKSIRPILAEACFACHGPDSVARKADLRLDIRDAALTGNAFVPAKPDESELVRRILSTDPNEMMPPPDSHKKLDDNQRQILIEWIRAGANYEPHWAYIPPAMPDMPEIRKKEWVRNPIDRFVLAKLESAGLEPAPEADLRLLLRRVSLDLTGLPPTPEQVEQVLMDPNPDRYERFVDRLLQTEQWAEHRARYWLDYARYADTHGIHFDNFREMWSYRDWVIEAFQQNMPFDQFSVEQLAGDLLPTPSLDQQIATGFIRCNITTNEGGAIDEEYKVLYTRDRTETAAQVWLGMTAGCAVCHDHKFDPLNQKEFYALSSFFNNTTQAAMDGNRRDTPPTIAVPLRADRDRYVALPGLIGQAKSALEQRRTEARAAFDQWIADPGKSATSAAIATPNQDHLIAHLPLNDGKERFLNITVKNESQLVSLEGVAQWQPGNVADLAWQNQESVSPAFEQLGDFDRTQPFTVAAWVKISDPNQGGALLSRMDEDAGFRGWDVWLEGGKVGMHLVNTWPGNALKVVSNSQLSPNQWHHVSITYDGQSKASGIRIQVDGQVQAVSVQADTLTETTRTQVPFRLGRRNKTAPTTGALLQDVRLFDVAIDEASARELRSRTRAGYLLQRPVDIRTAEETNELLDWYLNSQDEPFKQLTSSVASLESDKQQIESRGTVALIAAERPEPAKAFVLFRGEYDQRRDEVDPTTPSFLPPMAEGLPKNRLGFARWLFQPEHPLTARVTVNRFWQEVFGNGLVQSSGDFGIIGQMPSHPELLDYLALTFRDNSWNVKDFFKLIVTSSTYRQSSVVTPEKLNLDPQNRLLARGPRFRMDAEMVRDMALSASELLVQKIGGPSVRPYQPPGVWEAVAMPESNTKSYQEDKGEGLYRRSLYTFWKRAAPPASMDIFNAPNRETCAVRRERTNTPLQALLTLNDTQHIEAARMLAQRALVEMQGEKADNLNRIQHIATILMSRLLTAEELGIVQESLKELRAIYDANPELAKQLLSIGHTPPLETLDKSELAAWTMLANELMNLDEVLNK